MAISDRANGDRAHHFVFNVTFLNTNKTRAKRSHPCTLVKPATSLLSSPKTVCLPPVLKPSFGEL